MIDSTRDVGRVNRNGFASGLKELARRSAARMGRRAFRHNPVTLPPMAGALALGAEEERALRRVIRSQRLGRQAGPWGTPSECSALERQLAEYLGAPDCLVVSSGTAALHCALVGLEIGPGDEVIVPAYAWLTTATSVCNVGAVPVIADIDETLTLDPRSIERSISPHTRAIVAVHMRGSPARMDQIQAIADRFQLRVIEDAAQALGGSHEGRNLGTIGDVGCFSLQTYKLVCVGEGGAVVARDAGVMERMREFHGRTDGSTLSMNYGMSELAAAVGRVQLARVPRMLARMRGIKSELRRVLEQLALGRDRWIRGDVDIQGDTATCLTFFEATPGLADRTCAALRAEGVACSRGYQPGAADLHVYRHWDSIMHQRPLSPGGGPWRFAHREITYSPDMCPRALDVLGRAVEITILPQHNGRHVASIVRGMRKALSADLARAPETPIAASLMPSPAGGAGTTS